MNLAALAEEHGADLICLQVRAIRVVEGNTRESARSLWASSQAPQCSSAAPSVFKCSLKACG